MYRAALVGCGRMGGSIDDEVINYPAVILPYSHAAGYAAVDDVRLVAAADINEDARNRVRDRWGVDQVYSDYKAMIAETKPDILSIATHAPLHAEITVYAAENGVRGIYCEKPMACSIAEAERMRDACKANGTLFNIGTLRRYHPGYRKIRELVETGNYGEPKVAVFFGVGTLMHTHSHSIDTLSFLLGDPEPEIISARLNGVPITPISRFENDPGLDFATIKYRQGKEAYLIPCVGLYEFQLICSEAIFYALNNGINWYMRVRDRSQEVRRPIFDVTEFPEFGRVSPTVTCIRDLIDNLENGGTTLGNTDVGLSQMRISMAIVKSHSQGGTEVRIDQADPNLYIRSR